jgi:hypothetical protein
MGWDYCEDFPVLGELVSEVGCEPEPILTGMPRIEDDSGSAEKVDPTG